MQVEFHACLTHGADEELVGVVGHKSRIQDASARELDDIADLNAFEELVHLFVVFRLVIDQHALFFQGFGQFTRTCIGYVKEIGIRLEVELREEVLYLVLAQLLALRETAIGGGSAVAHDVLSVGIELMDAGHQSSATFSAVFDKTCVGTIAFQVGGDLQTLFRLVKMPDGIGLHTEIRQHAHHITAGVAHLFDDLFVNKGIALFSRVESFGIFPLVDNVQGKIAGTENTFFSHSLKLILGLFLNSKCPLKEGQTLELT